MNSINHSLPNFRAILDLFFFCAGGFLLFLNFVLVRRLCDIRQELEKLTNGLAKVANEQEEAKTRASLPRGEAKGRLGRA